MTTTSHSPRIAASRRITGVALRLDDGSMVSLPAPFRHHHLFSMSALLGIDPDGIGHTPGFTTDLGVFVDRTAAMDLVKATGQPMRNEGAQRELFSVDLW